MRLWITRLLVWGIKVLNAPPPDDATEKWLAETWLNKAARSYYASRERKLNDYLANGAGTHPEPRDAYLIAFGQKLELRIEQSHREACYNSLSKKLTQKKAS